MLSGKILEAQRGNQNCMLDLIRTFQQLLHKYAYKLHYEDAFSDLVISLIEVIYKIKIEDFSETGDGALVNYITQSINHTYFKLSKRANILSSKEQHVSDLTESQQFYMENAPAPEEEHLSKFKLMNITNPQIKLEDFLSKSISMTICQRMNLVGIKKTVLLWMNLLWEELAIILCLT